VICASGALAEGGDGVRFDVVRHGERVAAFAVRFGGEVHAYLNRCAHVYAELDWQSGKFFDSTGLVLICSMHGAIYDPASGACLGGPCGRGVLEKLAIDERDGMVSLKE